MSFQLLIVDDEVPIRKALASYIPWEEYNCTVYDTASNGKEAIKKLEAHPVDLVITDVKMPLIDGIELSKYIYDNYPDTLVIILSKDKLIAAVQNTLKQKKSVPVASKNAESDGTKYSIFVKQAMPLIQEHLTEDLSLEWIAEHVHSNASYLSRVFKKEVGMSVISYITDLRIKKANDLLEHSDLKTGETSEAVGIHDPAYFSVVFKKYTGMSPKAYKSSHVS